MRTLPLLRRADTTGKIVLGHANKNGIFSDTLNQIPRDNEIVGSTKPEKAIVSPHDQCKNLLTFLVKFKITGISQPCSIAKIDNFQSTQICRATSLHSVLHIVDSVDLSLKKVDTIHYMQANYASLYFLMFFIKRIKRDSNR